MSARDGEKGLKRKLEKSGDRERETVCVIMYCCCCALVDVDVC